MEFPNGISWNLGAFGIALNMPNTMYSTGMTKSLAMVVAMVADAVPIANDAAVDGMECLNIKFEKLEPMCFHDELDFVSSDSLALYSSGALHSSGEASGMFMALKVTHSGSGSSTRNMSALARFATFSRDDDI